MPKPADLNWSTQVQVPSVATSDSPSLAVYNGVLYMAWKGKGDDSRIWYATFKEADIYHTTRIGGRLIPVKERGSWSGQTQVPKVETSNSPSLAVYNGVLYMAWKGKGDDSRIWYAKYDGTWSTQVQVPSVATSDSPSLAVYNGVLYMAWKASHLLETPRVAKAPISLGGKGDTTVPADLKTNVWYATFDGSWSPRAQVPKVSIDSGPSIGFFNDALNMVWRGVGGDMRIWSATYKGSWAQAVRGPVVADNDFHSIALHHNTLYMAWKGKGKDSSIYYAITTSGWPPVQPSEMVGGATPITKPIVAPFVPVEILKVRGSERTNANRADVASVAEPSASTPTAVAIPSNCALNRIPLSALLLLSNWVQVIV